MAMQNFSEWRQLNNTTAKTLVSIGSTHLHVHVAVPWRRGGSYGIFIRFQLLNWNTFASQQRCIKYNLLPKTLSHSQRIAKKKTAFLIVLQIQSPTNSRRVQGTCGYTTLTTRNGKRRTADSFVVNKPSVSPETE